MLLFCEHWRYASRKSCSCKVCKTEPLKLDVCVINMRMRMVLIFEDEAFCHFFHIHTISFIHCFQFMYLIEVFDNWSFSWEKNILFCQTVMQWQAKVSANSYVTTLVEWCKNFIVYNNCWIHVSLMMKGDNPPMAAIDSTNWDVTIHNYAWNNELWNRAEKLITPYAISIGTRLGHFINKKNTNCLFILGLGQNKGIK